jgi:membrane protease subunit (stomatin/prohibitin family)
MALVDQLRSVIEWREPDPGLLFQKWTEHGDEIKNASKLIVGPGQGCVFVHEGKVQAVYRTEGLVNLETDNVPFWTTVKSLLQRMESEHKVGIYYCRTAELPNVRWGTPAPVKYADPVFKFPVGLGAFGNYSLKIVEIESFFRNIVAGAPAYEVRDLQQLILSRITPIIADLLGKARFSYVEIDGHRAEISAAVAQQVAPVFQALGFALTDFRIEGTSFDEETQARIGKIADMSAEAQAAAAAGVDWTQMQQVQAMRDAARIPNSTGGQAMSLAAGLGFGQQLGALFGRPMPGVAVAAPLGMAPPAPAAAAPAAGDDVTDKLVKLKKLFDAGLISEAEYAAKKKELLERL